MHLLWQRVVVRCRLQRLPRIAKAKVYGIGKKIFDRFSFCIPHPQMLMDEIARRDQTAIDLLLQLVLVKESLQD